MDYESAAMVEPVAVAVRALRQGVLRERDRVLVLGAGNIGLLLVQVARALGAGYVAVTDIVPERLALAEALGVDEALDVRGGFPTARLEKQFDVIIDGVANEASVRDALSSARRGARYRGLWRSARRHHFPPEGGFFEGRFSDDEPPLWG